MRLLELVRHALHGLLRARLRASLTAAGVAIASGSLVSMVAFAVGMQRQLERPLQAFGMLQQIRVRAAAPDDEPTARAEPIPGSRDAPPPRLDDAALERLRALDGVKYAAPDMQAIDVEVTLDGVTKEVRALGVPREIALLGLVDQLVKAGSFFSLSNEPEALIGGTLATELGFADPQAAVGRTLTITTARLELAGREVQLEKSSFEARIAGVFEPPSFAFRVGSRGLLLPIDQLHRIPGISFRAQLDQIKEGVERPERTYDRLLVGVASVGDVPRVERAIRELGFRTTAMLNELKEMRTAFVFMDLLLAAVGTVALIVAGLGILNTLLVTVLERTAEIGVYKAIGASDGDVRTIFLSEAAALGLAGGLAGLVLAWVVTAGLQVAIDAYARGRDVPAGIDLFHFPLWLLAGSVAFAVIVSVASGLYPASRAARVDPIEALRGM